MNAPREAAVTAICVWFPGVLEFVEEAFDAFSIHDRNHAYEAGDHHSWTSDCPPVGTLFNTWLRQVEALRQAA